MRRLIFILALVAVLIPGGVVRAAFELPSIKNKLIELALDQISTPGSFEITAEAIEDKDGVTSLIDVRVSDGTGIWMSLERLNFSWKPNQLLSGELAIDRLELIGLDVARPPSADAKPPELKPQEPWSKSIFDWPRSPISLVIEGVRLERVTIAEGVLPQAIRFDAEARAYDKGDLQELALSLNRTDSVEGAISLGMRRDFAAGTLGLTIAAREAPGGIVAAAAGLPPDAPARLDLRADGPIDDWKLDFDMAVERFITAAGKATLNNVERLSIDADFTVAPGPEMGAQMQTVLGEQARLQAKVIQRPDGLIEIVTGELTSPALTLKATGALATGAGESDLAVSLAALAPLADLAEGVAFDRFTFDGRVTGPNGALAAQGQLGLTGLRTAAVDAGALSLDGRVQQTADGGIFDLTGSGRGLRVDRVGPDVIGTAQLALDGVLAGDLLTLNRTVLEAQALGLEASGTYDLAASAGNLQLDLRAPEIGPIAAAYGAQASGRASASAKVALTGERVDAEFSTALERLAMEMVAADRLTLAGTVGVDGGAISFDIGGDGAALVLDQIPPSLTREVTLTAKGRMAEERLAIEGVTLASPLLNAAVSGTVATGAGTLAIDYSLATAELAPVARAYGAEASGALEATGRVEGEMALPRIAGRAAIGQATFDGRSYGEVALTHDVTVGPAPEGALTLVTIGGAFGDGEVATRFRLDGTQLTLDDLKARMIGVALSGRTEVNLETKLADAVLDVSIPDLRPVGAFAGTPLSGSLAGQVSLDTAEGRQNANADLTLTSFSTDGVAVSRAKLRLAAADALGTPQIDADVDAGGVQAAVITLKRLRARATGPLAAIDFTADASGTLGEETLAARLGGRADASDSVATVDLARAEVTVGTDKIRLRRPLALRVGGGIVEAKGIDLALPGNGALTGDAAREPGGLTGALTLRRFSLENLARWEVAPVTSGLLEAQARFDSRPGNAGAKVTVQARGVGFEKGQQVTEQLDMDLDARWDGARLDAKAEVRGDFGQPLRARFAMPVHTGAGGIPEPRPGGEVDGSVTWQGRLGDLWAMVPAAGHILDGEADIDMRMAGSLEAPRFSGRIDLNDGEYQNLDAGTILTDLKIATGIAEDGTLNVTLDGSDGAEGRIDARAALRPAAEGQVLDLTGQITRAVLVRRDDVTAEVSGDLTMTGPLNNLALKGGLTIDRAEVRLVNATPPTVVDLEGIRIKGEPQTDRKKGGDSIVTLDLTIRADRDIFVRGRGLDSEWKMDLAVTGDAAQPVVTGRIEKVRGQLELIGYPFDLARGAITFDGGRRIDPLIDIALEREANGIRGGIVVENRSSDPKLRFASSPALPEDEVMPRLLFGQSRQSLTGPQAIQLATGIATLMGGGPGVLDNLRGAAGLDVLRVEGQTAEDATVTVGRNIGENVFVGAKQGLGGAGSGVTVEVEVFDGVVVDTEVGQQGNSNIGITLRKDF